MTGPPLEQELMTDERTEVVAAADEGRAARRLAKPFLGAADALTILTAMTLAYQWRKSHGGLDITGAAAQHVGLALLALPIWLAMLARARLYNARFVVRRADELRRIANASLSASLAMAAIGYVLQLDVSRAWLLAAGVVAAVLLGLEREIARHLFARLRRRGRMLRRVVIVGNNDEARELALMLLSDPTLGYRVVGFVDDNGGTPDEELLGTTAETLEVVHRTNAGGVIVAASATSMGVCNRLVRDLVGAGVHVELSSTLRDIAAERLTVRPLGRFPVVYLEPRLTSGWRSSAKRTFDVVIAGTTMVLILPVLVAAAVAIRLDSPGPILFRQVRVGKNGRPFQLWKFRTMVDDAEERLAELRASNEADGPLFKLRNDPRVTRVGRILRKTSLDELPQLANVLRGQMSIVGPRPALPSEIEEWVPELYARLRVKPGITGMWQVNGRSDASFETYTRLDLYYVDNWSLTTDLSILAKTVPAVVFGRGSY